MWKMNDVSVVCPKARVTKISHLCSQNITMLEDEDVFRFDVAVNDIYCRLAVNRWDLASKYHTTLMQGQNSTTDVNTQA